MLLVAAKSTVFGCSIAKQLSTLLIPIDTLFGDLADDLTGALGTSARPSSP